MLFEIGIKGLQADWKKQYKGFLEWHQHTLFEGDNKLFPITIGGNSKHFPLPSAYIKNQRPYLLC